MYASGGTPLRMGYWHPQSTAEFAGEDPPFASLEALPAQGRLRVDVVGHQPTAETEGHVVDGRDFVRL